MALDDMYDPANNDYLTTLLTERGFDPTGITPRAFKNALGDECGALLIRRDSPDMAVLLHPGKGTGVVDHPGVARQTATYLGSIIDGSVVDTLKYKFQRGLSTERDESAENNPINEIFLGATFDTVVDDYGRHHGVHNTNDVPVVVLVHTETA